MEFCWTHFCENEPTHTHTHTQARTEETNGLHLIHALDPACDDWFYSL